MWDSSFITVRQLRQAWRRCLRTLYLSAVDVLRSIQIDAQDAKYEPPKGWMMDKQQLWVVRKISEDCNYLERAHTSTHVSRI